MALQGGHHVAKKSMATREEAVSAVAAGAVASPAMVDLKSSKLWLLVGGWWDERGK